jgi:hypothetical protein
MTRVLWITILLPVLAVVFAQKGKEKIKDVSFADSDLTVCDCTYPSFIGIISMADPSYCSHPVLEKKKKVLYIEITKSKPPLENTGYVCRQWLRQKSIVGFFFGGQDTTYLETPQLTTPEKCLEIVTSKKCDGNDLIETDKHLSFNQPPVAIGKWWSTVVGTIMNCDVEKIVITQECSDCPVKSSFGILADKANVTSLIRGHYTYIWEKPRVGKCNYKYTSNREGFLLDDSKLGLRRIRDENRQLEFAIEANRTKICDFWPIYKVKNIVNNNNS